MRPATRTRRLLPLVLATGTLTALAAGGCGEKSEPAVHPPTTAPTTAQTTSTPPATTTKPTPTPTAPVPKTTP